MYIYVNELTKLCNYIITIKKEALNLKKKQGWVYGMVWRQKKGSHAIIISKIKSKNLKIKILKSLIINTSIKFIF